MTKPKIHLHDDTPNKIELPVKARVGNGGPDEDFYFGRHFAKDDRDKKHRMKSVTPYVTVGDLNTTKYHIVGPCLDQSDYPHCVGYATQQFIKSSPTTTRKYDFGATHIYNGAQRWDEWEGENYDGTSVRGAFKWLDKEKNIIKEYLWALTLKELKAYILTRGTVVIGIPWSWSMCYPKHDGWLENDGYYIGGHAVLLVGYSHIRKAFRGINSWGRSWGQYGRFWMHEDLANELVFHEFGEAVSAIEK